MQTFLKKPLILAVVGFMVLFIGLLALYLANAIAMDKGADYGEIYSGASIFLFLVPASICSILWIRAGAIKTTWLGVLMTPVSLLLSFIATAFVFIHVVPLCG